MFCFCFSRQPEIQKLNTDNTVAVLDINMTQMIRFYGKHIVHF